MTLNGYLCAWMQWVENGAPQGQPFSRTVGLCGNLRYYAKGDITAYLRIHGELSSHLAGQRYPFGKAIYQARCAGASQHLCPTRLEWVKRTIAATAAAA